MAGLRIGPRIVAAGPILDAGPPDSSRMIVRNPEEGRRAVLLLSQIGVDFIKVHEHLDRETYFAIGQAAKMLNLPFAGHVPSQDMGFVVSGIEASEAGQRSLEHMFGIPFPGDKSIPLLRTTLRKNATWVTPTLTVFANRAHFRDLQEMNDSRKELVAPALIQFWSTQVAG